MTEIWYIGVQMANGTMEGDEDREAGMCGIMKLMTIQDFVLSLLFHATLYIVRVTHPSRGPCRKECSVFGCGITGVGHYTEEEPVV